MKMFVVMLGVGLLTLLNTGCADLHRQAHLPKSTLDRIPDSPWGFSSYSDTYFDGHVLMHHGRPMYF